MSNISRRNFLSAGFGLLSLTALSACGSNSSGNGADSSTLTIAATPTPHAEILNEFAAPHLAEQGITLKVSEFTDYIQPNKVVFNGEMDCNYFQHINYLKDYDEKNNENLVSVAKIHYEPFGIYAGKSKDLSNIAEGAVFAVPNDPTNEARALLLLQDNGIIKLKDPQNLASTPNDIVENPHKVEFREIEAAATPRALNDVDFAAINGNYALEANLHATDALVLEKSEGIAFEEYANIIATRPELENDERIKALVAVLATDDFKKFLSDKYGKDVLPAF